MTKSKDPGPPAVPAPPRYPEITVEIAFTPTSVFGDMLKIRKALKDAGHNADVPNFVFRAMDMRTQAEFLDRCKEWVTVKINGE